MDNEGVFSDQVLDHFRRPRNVGPLEDAIMGESGQEGDGPFVKIWVRIENGVIQKAAYRTYGCPACIACSSLVAELVSGRTTEIAALIEPKDVILILGGLPAGREHCAQMAVAALRRALEAAFGTLG